MNLQDWIPAFSTTALTLAAAWLLRNLISARLNSSVQHEFNEKLEHLKKDLRDADERLKAEIRAKELEISVLRSGALSAMASRQMAVDKRRLEAIDQLWGAFNSLGGARALSITLQAIDFSKAASYSEKDPEARKFFESLGTGFDPKTIDHAGAAKARPFVTPMTWATYSAYMAVCMHAVMRWHVLRFGLGPKDFTDNEAIKRLILAALPHLNEYIEKWGSDVYHLTLDSLETKLLSEVELMLHGASTDEASIRQAALILQRSNEVLQQASKEKSAV